MKILVHSARVELQGGVSKKTDLGRFLGLRSKTTEF